MILVNILFDMRDIIIEINSTANITIQIDSARESTRTPYKEFPIGCVHIESIKAHEITLPIKGTRVSCWIKASICTLNTVEIIINKKYADKQPTNHATCH